MDEPAPTFYTGECFWRRNPRIMLESRATGEDHSAERFNDRIRCTLSSVFHHISPRSRSSQASRYVAREGQQVTKTCGREYRLCSNFQAFSAPQLDARCDGRKPVESTSSRK